MIWTVTIRPGCFFTLRWRHNGHNGVSNHQPHGRLLNRLFRSKKTSKLRVTGLCVGNSPGTGEFPAQMASYTENVSIWWRHHDCNGWRSFHHHCANVYQIVKTTQEVLKCLHVLSWRVSDLLYDWKSCWLCYKKYVVVYIAYLPKSRIELLSQKPGTYVY